MPISTIEVGDLLEVRTGEKVPVDGEVVWAESFMTPNAAYIDESMITGEPNPAKKEKGDRVFGRHYSKSRKIKNACSPNRERHYVSTNLYVWFKKHRVLKLLFNAS